MHVPLCASLSRLPQILDLADNTIEDYGCTALCEALSCNSTLLELSVEANSIGQRGAESLALVLGGGQSTPQTSLKRLDASGNAFGDAGAGAIGEAIGANGRLDDLNLSNNGIGREGVCAIAVGVEMNRALKILELSGNRGIGGVGADALAAAVRVNSSLEQLILADCGVTKRGARSLARALEVWFLDRNLVMLRFGPPRGVAVWRPLW